MERKPYQTPKLTVHGDVAAITLGNTSGTSMDLGFKNNDKKPDLTGFNNKPPNTTSPPPGGGGGGGGIVVPLS